ncbi:MAG: hypothetical protein WBO29_06995 [Albidovulum sp.]
MKHTLLLVAAMIAFLSAPTADAACRVEYKAKMDNPLRLNFGTADLPDAACASKATAAKVLAPILQQQGWTLLAIVAILGGG